MTGRSVILHADRMEAVRLSLDQVADDDKLIYVLTTSAVQYVYRLRSRSDKTQQHIKFLSSTLLPVTRWQEQKQPSHNCCTWHHDLQVVIASKYAVVQAETFAPCIVLPALPV